MYYTDMHSHMLFGADDGPSRAEEMCSMVDEAYESGTRRICLTPHMAPAMFGNNTERIVSSYALLSDYCKGKYADITLSLGNEMHYHTKWREHVESGACRLLGGKFLLFDFPAGVSLFELRYAIGEILASGLPAVLAHAERYEALCGEYDLLHDFCQRGLLLQLNASAFTEHHSFRQRRHIKALIKRCPIVAVASDAHNLTTRPPQLSMAERVIASRYGEDAARFWLSTAPNQILDGKNPC